jgi:hypothetical protein
LEERRFQRKLITDYHFLSRQEGIASARKPFAPLELRRAAVARGAGETIMGQNGGQKMAEETTKMNPNSGQRREVASEADPGGRSCAELEESTSDCTARQAWRIT